MQPKTASYPHAVELLAQYDDALNGQADHIIAKIFGVTERQVRKDVDKVFDEIDVSFRMKELPKALLRKVATGELTLEQAEKQHETGDAKQLAYDFGHDGLTWWEFSNQMRQRGFTREQIKAVRAEYNRGRAARSAK